MKKRALLSVFNKDGVMELAGALSALGWELVSTGGTAAFLRKEGFAVIDAAEITGFPECLDGRVKTLHPAVHAGILAKRGEKSHTDALKSLNLRTIDLVAVNLYPFFQKFAENPPPPEDELLEFIDIGGPAMLRSAAKNFDDVIVLSDPADYGEAIRCLRSNGDLPRETRKKLAGKVFNLTSAYDAAVSQYLLDGEETAAAYHTPSLRRTAPLRYGENPQQEAALFLRTDGRGAISGMKQLGGKELGYNNYRDIDLAWKAVCSLGFGGARPLGADEAEKLLDFTDDPSLKACVAVKHNTPCGAALGKTAGEAFDKAYSCDTVSIFGGIAAFNTRLDGDAARKLEKIFLEVVIAPAFDGEALDILLKKTNLRVIEAALPPGEDYESVSVDGGVLVQQVNKKLLLKWELVTKTAVDRRDLADMLFGLRLVGWVKSNAIVVVKNQSAVGIGGGQTNRIRAAEEALRRAADVTGGAARVLVSDAFFPFPDVVLAAAEAGIRLIVQSGGSNNDSLSIEACDKHGVAMVFTGTRYFKH
ncbi:MAG: bifunctional phosphoribosylaminoimidazolecarboxamide formyltransferase/IMP cyclohydrolase [Spirochaetaceae bacterium]|jgi:phosphoribosylaminoimidazolecarboxamide formyltransferase/IMP cyclohydrolase|nr:bifunctional phosphoribosylaminoimidazolecarboxamide formyltransferase/IMP cyclohydrolase [Spirochaetaceae bacterium]